MRGGKARWWRPVDFGSKSDTVSQSPDLRFRLKTGSAGAAPISAQGLDTPLCCSIYSSVKCCFISGYFMNATHFFVRQNLNLNIFLTEVVDYILNLVCWDKRMSPFFLFFFFFLFPWLSGPPSTKTPVICFVLFSFLWLPFFFFPPQSNLLLWIYVSTRATMLNLCTSPCLRCAALNRQWLIYSMIVNFALLSVMDEDLCAFEKPSWNMVTSRGKGCLKGENAAGLWDSLSSFLHLVWNEMSPVVQHWLANHHFITALSDCKQLYSLWCK